MTELLDFIKREMVGIRLDLRTVDAAISYHQEQIAEKTRKRDELSRRLKVLTMQEGACTQAGVITA